MEKGGGGGGGLNVNTHLCFSITKGGKESTLDDISTNMCCCYSNCGTVTSSSSLRWLLETSCSGRCTSPLLLPSTHWYGQHLCQGTAQQDHFTSTAEASLQLCQLPWCPSMSVGVVWCVCGVCRCGVCVVW